MASEQAQPEGSYPRVNSSMLETNKYDQMIVSLVGIFQKSSGTNMDFLCSDNKVVQLNCEQMEIPPGVTEELTMMVDQNNATKYEVIGLVNGPNSVTAFVTRELSKDMDLTVYDKMLSVQNNPKFAQYFAPIRTA